MISKLKRKLLLEKIITYKTPARKRYLLALPSYQNLGATLHWEVCLKNHQLCQHDIGSWGYYDYLLLCLVGTQDPPFLQIQEEML